MENSFENKSFISELEMKLQEELKSCVQLIMNAAKEKKATDIIAVRVADKTIIADWFIFMSGSSQLHVKSICDEIEDKAQEARLELRRREGYNEGRWIVLDYSNILVHIFHPEEREYYNVERLWIDATTEVLRCEGEE